MVPSQHNGQSQVQQNGAPRTPGGQPENSAILHLIPMNGTFERKTITVPFYPDVLRIGRQTNNKTIPTPLNGYFDSKVLSRQHAEIWADRNGKIWIRDVKSSNGTFVNGQRLSQENRDSDPHELREQDMLELGIDIVSEDQKTIVHHKVAARVEHAGIYPNTGNSMLDLNFGELDSPQIANIISPGGPQGIGGMRGRTGSQGSMNGGRLQTPSSAVGGNMGGMGQQRHMNFWLQPITMEQVVKRLNTEIKQARQQSQDLQRTSQYIDSVLTTEPKKEPVKASPSPHIKVSPIKADLKARFSDPPAPPPQQPLPEKPDANQPSLRRSETERPKSNSSPVRSDSQLQLSSLAEALTTAKKEIESQSLKLQDLETLLKKERLLRESAEERAQRLEMESRSERPEPALPEATNEVHVNGVCPEQEDDPEPTIVDEAKPEDEAPTNPMTDAATARLQQRLEMMVAEMDEMKQQMEKYRQRAENAEAENATHRKTLAEMVEKIRQDDADCAAREARKERRRSESEASPESISATTNCTDDSGEILIVNEKEDESEATSIILKTSLQNGGPVSPERVAELEKVITQTLATHPGRNDAMLIHGGPAASIFGIVLIGVGLMAWLNSYPKVER